MSEELRAGEREAWLGLQGWEGATWQRVAVVGETPTRYRIRALTENTRLGGRHRYLHPDGPSALVPKGAVRFKAPGRLTRSSSSK